MISERNYHPECLYTSYYIYDCNECGDVYKTPEETKEFVCKNCKKINKIKN